MIVRRHFRRVFSEFLLWVVIWLFAFISAVFTESFYEPMWQGRARWSSWPVVLLLPLPIIRTARLLFSRWAIRVDGDLLQTRASMWRDFSYRFSEVSTVSLRELKWGRATSHYPLVELRDGRRHGVFDRYLDVPEDFDLVAILKGDYGDKTS